MPKTLKLPVPAFFNAGLALCVTRHVAVVFDAAPTDGLEKVGLGNNPAGKLGITPPSGITQPFNN